MNEEEYVHPADAILSASADALEAAQTPEEKLRILLFLAGGDAEMLFFKTVFSTPEMALRLSYFKNLKDLYGQNKIEELVEQMEFLSRASLAVDPDSLEDMSQQYRNQYDEEQG